MYTFEKEFFMYKKIVSIKSVESFLTQKFKLNTFSEYAIPLLDKAIYFREIADNIELASWLWLFKKVDEQQLKWMVDYAKEPWQVEGMAVCANDAELAWILEAADENKIKLIVNVASRAMLKRMINACGKSNLELIIKFVSGAQVAWIKEDLISYKKSWLELGLEKRGN